MPALEFVHPLEHYRVEAGLSQAEAAEQSGVNVKTLRNAEHGVSQLQIPNITKLARLYGVEPSQLLAEIRQFAATAAA